MGAALATDTESVGADVAATAMDMAAAMGAETPRGQAAEERGNPTDSPNRHPQAGALRPVNIDPGSGPSLAYLPPSIP